MTDNTREGVQAVAPVFEPGEGFRQHEEASMTLKDAYRKTPTSKTEAAGMLSMIREHNRQGLRGDRVMNITNSRIAYLQGWLDAR